MRRQETDAAVAIRSFLSRDTVAGPSSLENPRTPAMTDAAPRLVDRVQLVLRRNLSMSESMTAVLRDQVLPALEQLKLPSLIVAGEAGKTALGPYPPGGRSAKELALADGEDLPGGTWKYEGHGILEVVFGIRGRAELALAGHRYVVTEGDAAIVSPNLPHLERIINRNQGYHLLWVQIRPDRIAFHTSSYSQGNRFQLVRGAVIVPSGPIGRCFEAAAEETTARKALWFSLVRARLSEAVALAVRHFETHGSGQNSGQVRVGTVDIAKTFIQAHFSEDLTLERVAGSVFLSPNYFSSLFTQTSGMTVFDYVRRVRLEEAQRLLSQTKLPIRDVAKTTGFPTRSHFVRSFRKHAGCLPRDYRRRQKPSQV